MRRLLFAAMAVFALSGPARAEETPILGYEVRTHPAVASHGMVVSRHRIASEAGAAILAQGGNAVDAAVATAFALAVVLPSAGNLGGGGFMLVYLAEEGKTIALDYREMAPRAAAETMFLDAEGNVDREMVGLSRASSGVPGTVAGLWQAHQAYGKLPWRDVMAPAIRLAREGFPITLNLVNNLNAVKARLMRFPGGQKFFKPDGAPFAPGETFRQPELARTLALIAEQGPDVFYKGEIADLIVAEMARGNGLITREDLAAYRVVARAPVTGSYRGYQVVSMPPPSSGGVHVIQMLNILENFDLAAMGAGSAAAFSKMAEAMKFAFADRSRHLGDPDFYEVPVAWLASKVYAAEIAERIAARPVTPSSGIAPGLEPAPDGPDTTHISVVDADGNAVSNTFTLNYSFGSGIVVEGAGFLLNNEMDDFSAKPGAPNAYGMLGDEANAIAPGKRPLSSMTPVIVLKDGRLAYVLGSPGGSLIITAVLQAIVNLVEFKMPLGDAILFDRVHHQWQPDVLTLDPFFNAEARRALEAMGYATRTMSFMPVVEGVEVAKDGWLFGFSDLRRADGGAAGICRADEAVAC